MAKELCMVIDQLSREKGIPKESLLKLLENVLLSAARAKFGGRENVNLHIEPKNCEIKVYETKTVVEKPVNKDEEISLEEALKDDPRLKLGDTIDLPISLLDFGRIDSQKVKQVIFQRVREHERDIIFEEYKDRVGQIVSGTVLRKEKGLYFIHIGKTEAMLSQRDTLPRETLKRGDIIKAYLAEVRQSPRGPAIILSRTEPRFVTKLFEMEVPEIADGVVIIKDVAREPGERTKIAVISKDTSVDPVGACVGMKGTRVQSIVRELRGERIDIIPWSDDPRIFIARALTPATVDRVGVSEEGKTAMVIAEDQQRSLAIGKRGQNIKLATKLTGWEIDILSETEYSKVKLEETEKSLDDAVRNFRNKVAEEEKEEEENENKE